MSDWQIGDLALCVDDSPCSWSGIPCPCRAGRIYTVTGIVAASDGAIGLRLGGVSFRHTLLNAIYEGNFRKIRPDEHQACEPEFVTLLRKSKQRVGA